MKTFVDEDGCETTYAVHISKHDATRLFILFCRSGDVPEWVRVIFDCSFS